MMFNKRRLPPPTNSPPPIPALPDIIVTELPGTHALDSTIADASRFFNANYGTWARNVPLRRPGGRIKMSPRLLQEEVFPRHLRGQTQIVRALRLEPAEYCGHVISVNWTTPDGIKVCWITQMVVKTEYRSKGVAEAMLRELKRWAGVKWDVVGIASVHPHATMAVCRVFGNHAVEALDLEFMRMQAAPCMAWSPVRYVREGRLHGTLFGMGTGDASVASLNTVFMVEEEPVREAMRSLFGRGRRWPLGPLPLGHEWLCLVGADWSEPQPEPKPEPVPSAAAIGSDVIDPQLIADNPMIDPRLLTSEVTTS